MYTKRLRFSFRTYFVIRHSSFAAYKPRQSAGSRSMFTRLRHCFDRWLVGRVNWPMRFWKVPIILTFLLMCADFLPGQTQSGSEKGVEGVITINPARPGPIRADAPVSPLANIDFAVENQKGEVASFTTDNDGRFRVPLAPGHYK